MIEEATVVNPGEALTSFSPLLIRARPDESEVLRAGE